ncbi:hypothetical protein EJ02DRAFT_315470, partial [Clathrospora elynae]
GALFTTPVLLKSLAIEDRSCPICQEAYIEPVAPGKKRDEDNSKEEEEDDQNAKEWPVSIDMVAEHCGLKRCCGHVIGRKCLERHLQSHGAWRNKCPLCRDVWFGNDAAENTPDEQDQAPPSADDRLRNPLRRSARIAAQMTATRRSQGSRMSDRHGVTRRPQCASVSGRSRSASSAGFMQQLLGMLEIESGGDEVKGTLEEVERRLGALYGDA